MRSAVYALVPSFAPGQTGWLRVVCPNCLAVDGKRRDNLAVNLETGYYQCWRCDARGSLRSSGPSAFDRSRTHARTDLPPEVPLPEGFTPIHDLVGNVAKLARAFLSRRGVSDEAVRAVGLGVVVGRRKYGGRIIVPVTIGGRVCGFTARLFVDADDAPRRPLDGWRDEAARVVRGEATAVPKYLYPRGMSRLAMLNRDALELVTKRPVALVEGSFDYLPHWPDAVAFLGKPTEEQLEFVAARARRPVVFALDGDAWREAGSAATRVSRLAPHVKVAALRVAPGVDPGAMNRDDFADLVEAAIY